MPTNSGIKTKKPLKVEWLFLFIQFLRNAYSASGTNNYFDYKPKYQADCAESG